MSAIFLLLIKNNPGILQYSQAILDFVTMVGYTSHIKEILQYISHALMQINKTKEAFRDIYCNDAQI